MKTAIRLLQLTGRAYYRVLKLSRTFADLVGTESITHAYLVKVLQYRPYGSDIVILRDLLANPETTRLIKILEKSW